MRVLATAAAASVISAALMGVSGTQPAQSAATSWSCGVAVGAVDAGGHYRRLVVDDVSDAPGMADFGVAPVSTPLRALATGTFDADPSIPDLAWQEVFHFGTTTNALVQVTARIDQEGRTLGAQVLATRWGGFRRLVFAGMSTLPTDYLYGLHDNGTLNRYRITWNDGVPSAASAGRLSGYGDLKTIALVGRTSSYDALLANTVSGQLVVIKIPTRSTMSATRTVIRNRTWQGFEHLAVETCADGTSSLLGVDSDTGAAYAYSMEFLRGPGSSIAGLGRVGGSWKYGVLSGVTALASHPRGA